MIENKYLLEIFKASPLPSLLLMPNSPHFTIIAANIAYLKITNKTEVELIGKGIFEVFSEKNHQNSTGNSVNLFESLNATIALNVPQKMDVHRYDLNGKILNDSQIHFWEITNTPIASSNNGLEIIIHSVNDITESRYFNILEKLEREILELNALNIHSLSDIISKYLIGIESLHPGMICSMQELVGNKLYNLASPSLPDEYLKIIYGLEIGEFAGSCGTAAYLKQNVIVSDIQNDVRWDNYRKIANKFNFKSCWSHPLLNQNGQVLATFACYYSFEKSPDKFEQNTITRAGNILKIIFENNIHLQAIQKSEEQFRALINDMQIGVLLHGEKSEIKLFNSKSLELLGLSEDQLLGRTSIDPTWNVIREDGSPFPLSMLPVPQAFATGKPIHDVIIGVYRPSIGDRIWLLVNANPTFNSNNSLQNVVCTFVDITKRKYAEEELRVSKSTYSGLINSISELIYIQDENGHFLDVNETVVRTYGYEKEYFIGKTPEFLSAPDRNDMQKVLNLIELAWKGVPQSFEFWGITKDGNVFPKEVNISLGNYFGKSAIIAVARNVSERKTTEAKVHASEERLSNILINTADWAWETDETGCFTFVSDKCIELFGYNPEHFIGKTPYDFMSIDEAEKVKLIMKDLTSKKLPLKDVENWNMNSQGEKICLLTNGLPIFDMEGNYKGYRGVDKNITERKQAEEKIRKSEKLLRKIIDNAPIGIWYMNSLGKMEFVNKVFCEAVGISETQFIDAPHYSVLYPPQLAASCMASDLEAFNNEGPQLSYDSILFADGKIHDLELIKFQLIEENTGKPGLIGLMRDITNENEAKLKLEASENRYRTLIELSPEPIVVNCNGKIIYVNAATIKLFGANSADDLLGKATIDFVHPDYKEFTIQRMEVVMNNGPDFDMGETKLFKLDGTILEVEAQGNAIVFNGVPAIQITMRDVTKRKQAEKEIFLSNERYELVTKATSDSIWDWNLITDKVVRSGEGFKSLFGYNPEDAINDNQFWQKIVHPDDLPLVSDSIFAALANPEEQYWEYEFRIKKACSAIIYVKDKGYIIRDENGKAIRMIGATQDIDSRKKSELALIENIKSLEDYKFALNQSANIAMTNAEGIIVSVNENFCRISEFSQEELIGKTHQMIKSNYHADVFYTKMWQTISSGKVWKGDIKNKAKSGNFFWVNVTIIPFLDNNKKPIQFLAINFDITERKNAEEALLQSNERYNLVAKATNDSIWDWDLKTDQIKRTGDGFKILFGYDFENMIGDHLNWKKLIHPDDLLRVQHSLETVFANPNIFYWEQDFKFLKANGTYAHVNDKGYIIRDKNGNAIRMIGATQNITERVKHLNAIEAQNKKLRQIAWDQSHVVRAPLSRMMAIVSLLKEMDITAVEFKEWVKHFEESGKELDKVIHEITDKSEEIDLDN